MTTAASSDLCSPCGPAKTLRLEVIPYAPSLAPEVCDIWAAVASLAPGASAFTSPEWISAWLTIYGSSLTLQLLVWRSNDGAAKGVCLLGQRSVSIGLFRVQALFLNASGEQQVASEHNCVLCAQEYERTIIVSLAGYARTLGVDLMRIVGSPAATVSELQSAWPEASLGECVCSEDPYVELEPLRIAKTPYLATLSPNTRYQVKRSMRFFENRSGSCVIERAQDADQAETWFAQLQELHVTRWTAKGEESTFVTRAARAFHGILISRCLAADDGEGLAVDVLRVRSGSDTIALLYNLRYRGIVSFYQAGLRFESDNNCRPGLVAHALAIQYYVDTGAREYDFLAGESEPTRYKRSLAKDTRTLIWAELTVPTRRMMLIVGARRLRRLSARFFGTSSRQAALSPARVPR